MNETPALITPVQIMFFDTDCAGVVHNIAYLRFIETNRTLLGEQLGIRAADMIRTGLYAVVVRTEIDYRRPVRLGDPIQVRGRLERIGRSRFWMAFEVVRGGEQEEVMAACRQMLALVQMPSGKPARLPAEWKTKYAHLAGEP